MGERTRNYKLMVVRMADVKTLAASCTLFALFLGFATAYTYFLFTERTIWWAMLGTVCTGIALFTIRFKTRGKATKAAAVHSGKIYEIDALCDVPFFAQKLGKKHGRMAVTVRVRIHTFEYEKIVWTLNLERAGWWWKLKSWDGNVAGDDGIIIELSGGAKDQFQSPGYYMHKVNLDGWKLPERLRTQVEVETQVWAWWNRLKEEKTAEVCLEAVMFAGQTLQYVPPELRSAQVCLEAVNRFGWALKWVPPELRTAELCAAAVRQFARAIEHVPKGLRPRVEAAMKINATTTTNTEDEND